MDKNCTNKALCLAPWTHAFVNLNGERKLCSVSTEACESALTTLDEFWNSKKVREVRRQMLRGETPIACLGCKDKKNSCQDDFNKNLSTHVLEIIKSSTAEDGTTIMKPRSYDYRFSNKCNFKCRTCSEVFSSSWELENNLHKTISYYKVDGQVKTFQKEVLEKEFIAAIKDGAVEEIHWTGGEPLKWDLHWQVMQFLVDSELAKNVFVRYTTNLSSLDWKGRNLFDEYLTFFKGFQIKASLYSTGEIGEYIRSGLVWNQWVYNLDYAIANTNRSKNQEIILDLLVTLPGIFDLPQILQFVNQRDLKLECKVYENLENLPLMSPLILPREILESLIEKYAKLIFSQASVNNLKIFRELLSLKKKQTLQEKFPHEWQNMIKDGKEHLLSLEARRPLKLALTQIIEQDSLVSFWWNQIT